MGALLQGNELLLLFAIILLILGPSKLPALARGLGQAIREFRRAAQGLEEPIASSSQIAPSNTTPQLPSPEKQKK